MNTVEHEISACVLYIAHIASGAASLFIKTLYFCLFLTTGGADVNETAPLKQELEVSCAAAIFILVVAAR